MISDVDALVQHCRMTLDLAGAQPPTEFYQSLPLCVIDTVFSINATYQSTQNTVARFCAYFALPYRGPMRHPPLVEQLSIGRFLKDYDTYGLNFFADAVYKNRQRTSTTNGILKAEAVQRFAQVLRDFGVQYLQHAPGVVGSTAFEQAIQAIPGQQSGVSLRYFYILIGSDAYVKPDRMIRRFVQDATGRAVTVAEAHELVTQVSRSLSQDYPALTPAHLDNMIWQYQRNQTKRLRDPDQR